MGFHIEAEIVQGERITRIQFQCVAQDVFRFLGPSLLQQSHRQNVSAIDPQLQVAVGSSDVAQFVAFQVASASQRDHGF